MIRRDRFIIQWWMRWQAERKGWDNQKVTTSKISTFYLMDSWITVFICKWYEWLRHPVLNLSCTPCPTQTRSHRSRSRPTEFTTSVFSRPPMKLVFKSPTVTDNRPPESRRSVPKRFSQRNTPEKRIRLNPKECPTTD